MTKIVIIIVNFIYLFIFACVTGTTSLLLTGVAAYTNISCLTLSRTKALAKPRTSQTCDGHFQSRTQSPPHFDSFSETTPFSLPNLVIRPKSDMAELKDYIAEASTLKSKKGLGPRV